MGDLQDPIDGGTVPYKAIFSGDIPLHRPYIGLIYGRYLQFRILEWPLMESFFYPLVICYSLLVKIAIEIVNLPMKSGDFLWLC